MKLILILSLAWPAGAQLRGLPAAPSAPAGPIAPILLGSPSSPTSPISKELAAQLTALAALPELNQEAAQAYLKERLSGEHVERASAAVLARALSERGRALEVLSGAVSDAAVRKAGSRVLRELKAGQAAPLAALAAQALHPPASAALFDGEAEKDPLKLRSLQSYGDKLRFDGAPAEFIGRGEYGAVFGHPEMPGAVVKMVAPSAEIMLFGGASLKEIGDEEETVSRALADAGAGPRHFGQGRVDYIPTDIFSKFTRRFRGKAKRLKQLASVRERVYGKTLEALIRNREFGREEYRLVQDMLDRMADARVKAFDMRLANVMIGRTLAAPELKAYQVDGGKLVEVPDEMTRDELRADLHRQYTVIKWRLDKYVGIIESGRYFDDMLQEGLKRSEETTWWEKFKRFFSEMMENAYFPDK